MPTKTSPLLNAKKCYLLKKDTFDLFKFEPNSNWVQQLHQCLKDKAKTLHGSLSDVDIETYCDRHRILSSPPLSRTNRQLSFLTAMMMKEASVKDIGFDSEVSADQITSNILDALINCHAGLQERTETLFSRLTMMNDINGMLASMRYELVDNLARQETKNLHGMQVHEHDLYFIAAQEDGYGVSAARGYYKDAKFYPSIHKKIHQAFQKNFTPLLIIENIESRLLGQLINLGFNLSEEISIEKALFFKDQLNFMLGSDASIYDVFNISDDLKTVEINWINVRRLIAQSLVKKEIASSEILDFFDSENADAKKFPDTSNTKEIIYWLGRLVKPETARQYLKNLPVNSRHAIIQDFIQKNEHSIPQLLGICGKDHLKELLLSNRSIIRNAVNKKQLDLVFLFFEAVEDGPVLSNNTLKLLGGNEVIELAFKQKHSGLMLWLIKAAQNDLNLRAQLFEKNPIDDLMHWACEKGHTEIVLYLLAIAKDNPEFLLNGIPSAIQLACKHGHLPIVKLILEHAKTNRLLSTLHKDLPTALIESCRNGALSIVCELINQIEENNDFLKEMLLFTVLADKPAQAIRLAYENNHAKVVLFLLKKANPDLLKELIVAMDPSAAMRWACENGYTEIVSLLIQGAAGDKNILEKLSAPEIIHAVCRNGRSEDLTVILEDVKNSELENEIIQEFPRGFQLACENGQSSMVVFLLGKIKNNQKMLSRIILNPTDGAFHVACKNGHEGTTRLILETAKNNDEIYEKLKADSKLLPTALQLACEHNHVGIVNLLLEQIQTEKEVIKRMLFASGSCEKPARALQIAFEKRNLEIIYSLLLAASRPSQDIVLLKNLLLDMNVSDVMKLACEEGHLEIVKLVLENAKDNEAIQQTITSSLPMLYKLAVEKNQIQIVRHFLSAVKSSPDLFEKMIRENNTSTESLDALSLACKNGHKEMVEILLEAMQHNQEVIEKYEKELIRAFQLACLHGHTEIVDQLLQGNPKFLKQMLLASGKDKKPAQAIRWACEKGHSKIACLVMKSAQVDPELLKQMLNAVTNNENQDNLIDGVRYASSAGEVTLTHSLLLVVKDNPDDYQKMLLAAQENAIKSTMPNLNPLFRLLVDEHNANFDGVNEQGESLLRIVSKNHNKQTVQFLVETSTDLSAAFSYKHDLKNDAPLLALKFLGCWIAISAAIYGLSVGIGAIVSALHAHDVSLGATRWRRAPTAIADSLFDIAFHSMFFSVLWIAAIVAVVIGLIITACIFLCHFSNKYVTAPGYLGEQQNHLIAAVDNKNFDEVQNILRENINWLFPKITLFNNSALMMLSKSKEGRDFLMQIMPEIAASPSALKNLFTSEENKAILFKRPELLSVLFTELGEEEKTQYADHILAVISKNISFFKQHTTKDEIHSFAQKHEKTGICHALICSNKSGFFKRAEMPDADFTSVPTTGRTLD